MAEVDAAKVKELRERSGAGMMDCKRALTEAGGDMDKAVDWLRSKGLAAAAKKAGRVAAEGLVAVATDKTRGVAVEVNSETDFVARNDKFQDLVRNVAKVALGANGDYDKAVGAPYPGTKHTVGDQVKETVAAIGENIQFRRAKSLSVAHGAVVSYIHNVIAPDMGKIAVLVALESTGDVAKLAALGKQLAMHIAAANPQSLTVETLDPAAVERERAVFAEQSKASGKPADIIAKMVDGRLRKFYGEAVLLEQVFVIDGETKVAQVVENAAKDVGAPVKLAGFVRYALGEGIEKKQEDFAQEVAAVAGVAPRR